MAGPPPAATQPRRLRRTAALFAHSGHTRVCMCPPQGTSDRSQDNVPAAHLDVLRCITSHRPVVLASKPASPRDESELFVVSRVAVGLGKQCFFPHVCEPHASIKPLPLRAIDQWRTAVQQCVGLTPGTTVLNSSTTAPVVTFVQRRSASHR